jgi:hypothetical protein
MMEKMYLRAVCLVRAIVVDEGEDVLMGCCVGVWRGSVGVV